MHGRCLVSTVEVSEGLVDSTGSIRRSVTRCAVVVVADSYPLTAIMAVHFWCLLPFCLFIVYRFVDWCFPVLCWGQIIIRCPSEMSRHMAQNWCQRRKCHTACLWNDLINAKQKNDGNRHVLALFFQLIYNLLVLVSFSSLFLYQLAWFQACICLVLWVTCCE